MNEKNNKVQAFNEQDVLKKIGISKEDIQDDINLLSALPILKKNAYNLADIRDDGMLEDKLDDLGYENKGLYFDRSEVDHLRNIVSALNVGLVTIEDLTKLLPKKDALKYKSEINLKNLDTALKDSSSYMGGGMYEETANYNGLVEKAQDNYYERRKAIVEETKGELNTYRKELYNAKLGKENQTVEDYDWMTLPWNNNTKEKAISALLGLDSVDEDDFSKVLKYVVEEGTLTEDEKEDSKDLINTLIKKFNKPKYKKRMLALADIYTNFKEKNELDYFKNLALTGALTDDEIKSVYGEKIEVKPLDSNNIVNYLVDYNLDGATDKKEGENYTGAQLREIFNNYKRAGKEGVLLNGIASIIKFSGYNGADLDSLNNLNQLPDILKNNPNLKFYFQNGLRKLVNGKVNDTDNPGKPLELMTFIEKNENHEKMSKYINLSIEFEEKEKAYITALEKHLQTEVVDEVALLRCHLNEKLGNNATEAEKAKIDEYVKTVENAGQKAVYNYLYGDTSVELLKNAAVGLASYNGDFGGLAGAELVKIGGFSIGAGIGKMEGGEYGFAIGPKYSKTINASKNTEVGISGGVVNLVPAVAVNITQYINNDEAIKGGLSSFEHSADFISIGGGVSTIGGFVGFAAGTNTLKGIKQKAAAYYDRLQTVTLNWDTSSIDSIQNGLKNVFFRGSDFDNITPEDRAEIIAEISKNISAQLKEMNYDKLGENQKDYVLKGAIKGEIISYMSKHGEKAEKAGWHFRSVFIGLASTGFPVAGLQYQKVNRSYSENPREEIKKAFLKAKGFGQEAIAETDLNTRYGERLDYSHKNGVITMDILLPGKVELSDEIYRALTSGRRALEVNEINKNGKKYLEVKFRDTNIQDINVFNSYDSTSAELTVQLGKNTKSISTDQLINLSQSAQYKYEPYVSVEQGDSSSISIDDNIKAEDISEAVFEAPAYIKDIKKVEKTGHMTEGLDLNTPETKQLMRELEADIASQEEQGIKQPRLVTRPGGGPTLDIVFPTNGSENTPSSQSESVTESDATNSEVSTTTNSVSTAKKMILGDKTFTAGIAVKGSKDSGTTETQKPESKTKISGKGTGGNTTTPLGKGTSNNL